MSYRTIPFNQLGKAGYNRGISRAHVNQIKRDFREDMVQPAIVSSRDGKYWIIDHQHQTQAIYELNGNDPNTPIKCDVRTGLTYEQEAELYYRLNTGTKPLGFADKLMGLIEAKDENALRFRDVVESCGYVIGGNTVKSLRALSTAWNVYNGVGGEELLRSVLELTYACWPNNPNGVCLRMLDGMLEFLDHHADEFQRDMFVKKLSQCDPKEIVRKATSYYKQVDSRAFTMPYCTYTIIVNGYNVGLRNKLDIASPRA